MRTDTNDIDKIMILMIQYHDNFKNNTNPTRTRNTVFTNDVYTYTKVCSRIHVRSYAFQSSDRADTQAVHTVVNSIGGSNSSSL